MQRREKLKKHNFPLYKAKPRSQLLLGWVPQGHSAVAPKDAWPGGVQWRLAECTSFWDSIDLAHRLKIMPNNNNPINLASILPFLVKNLASIWLIATHHHVR